MLLTLLSRTANTSIQCPVEQGEYTVSHTVALPKEIPQGLLLKYTVVLRSYFTLAKFNVNVRGYTVDDGEMLCLNLKVDFMKLPFPSLW